jgi:hypothetical protein
MSQIEFCEIATAAVNTKLSEVRSEVAAKLQGTRPKKGATLLLRECEEGVATDQVCDLNDSDFRLLKYGCSPRSPLHTLIVCLVNISPLIGSSGPP